MALDAFGTTLSRGDGGDPETFSPIANLINPSGPSTERDTYDVTDHDSPDGWRRFIGGLKDGGEISADIHFMPATHLTLLDDYEDPDPINYELAWPDGSKAEFAAVLTGFEPDAPFDDKLTASVTWKVSGKPVFTEAV